MRSMSEGKLLSIIFVGILGSVACFVIGYSSSEEVVKVILGSLVGLMIIAWGLATFLSCSDCE